MSGSLIGALRVTLGIDTAAFEQGLTAAQAKLSAAGQQLQAIGGRMTSIGANMTVGVTAPLVAFGASAVQAANESAVAMGQVNAALDSMGPVAGRTSEQLQQAAEDLQHLSTFDDDDILKSVTANMLTFGNISGDVFDRAQLAAVNLSARLGMDLQSATLMVGKALNDPVKGLAALGRAGIQFTAEQKDMIKSLVAGGDAAGAQAIMLAELERQFNGSAKAARDATPNIEATEAWAEFQEIVGAIVVKIIPPLSEGLARVLNAFNNLSPATQSFIVGAAGVAAAVGPVLIVLGSVVSAVGTLMTAFAGVGALFGTTAAATTAATAATGTAVTAAATATGGIGAALGAAAAAAAPFIAAAAAVAAVGYVIYENWDKIAPVLNELKEKFTATIGPKLSQLIDTVKQKLTDLWQGPFGDAVRVVIDVLGDFMATYSSVMGDGLLRVLSALVSAVEGSFKVFADVLGVVGGILTGDFSAAWESAKSLVSSVITTIINVLKSLAPEAITAVQNMATGFHQYLTELAQRMMALGRNIVQGLVAGIMAAPDAVWNALKSIVLRGVENVREFLGIASPSRLFMEMGGFVTSGLALGILGGIGTVKAVMDTLSEAVGEGMEVGKIMNLTDAAGEATDDLGDSVKQTTEQVVKDFGEMAAGVIRSLGNLKDTIKNGGFFDVVLGVLDGVSTVLDAIGQIKGISGVGPVLGGISGRVSGGPVLANTPYIVGERRAELFVPSTAGRLEPNLNGSGRASGGNTINNYFGPGADEFWGKIAQGNAQAARQGAAGGAQMAVQQLQRARQRSLA